METKRIITFADLESWLESFGDEPYPSNLATFVSLLGRPDFENASEKEKRTIFHTYTSIWNSGFHTGGQPSRITNILRGAGLISKERKQNLDIDEIEICKIASGEEKPKICDWYDCPSIPSFCAFHRYNPNGAHFGMGIKFTKNLPENRRQNIKETAYSTNANPDFRILNDIAFQHNLSEEAFVKGRKLLLYLLGEIRKEGIPAIYGPKCVLVINEP